MAKNNRKGKAQAQPRPGNGNLKPFPPGQSGNPAGRPPGRSLSARLREIIEKDANPAKAGGKDIGQVLMQKLVELAIKGNVKAIAMVLERMDGAVPQVIEAEVSQSLDLTNLTDKQLEQFITLAGKASGPEGGLG